MQGTNTLLPYQDKSLADMPGETWKDIPGFEGIYQASNSGRIKSLDRTIAHPRLYKQFVKSQILSQSVSKNQNIKTGEPTIDLRVTLTVENQSYYFNTRRLVYMTFIDPKLDYKKDKFYIINVVGDGYNNRPENLKAVTHSEKQLHAHYRGRGPVSNLKTDDRTNWKRNDNTSRPVSQYDLKGNLLSEYKSVKEAMRQTGIWDKNIIDVAKGKYKQWNGFVWKYAKKTK
ncbi:MAG TPA: NUMOD4 domain-containing protein [Mucilaginibacter sp.]|jgi:hypothetical protein|nr:NUMOD4 domain-containing protein [Mucilaginibacter sp.]